MRRACLSLLFLSLSAGAAELRSVDVDRVEGRYVMHSEVWFAAGIESVYAVFLDWDLSPQFSSFIVEARNVEPGADGRPRFYVRNRGCILFFCTSAERNGFVEHDPHRIIRATIDPEASDFHFSNESWRFHEEDAGTVVIYDLEFKPKFWIPPVIGPYFVQRKLRRYGGGAFDRIEAIAQEWKP